MDPLTIATLASGGLKLWNTYSAGKAQQEEEKRKKQFYQSQIGEMNKFKQEQLGDQKSSSTDSMTNYITTRDNEKATGIANMYLQRYDAFKNSIRNTDLQIAGLQKEMQNVGNTSNSQIYGNMLGDAVNTGTQLYGQYANKIAEINTDNKYGELKSMLTGNEFTPKETPGFGKSLLDDLGFDKGGMWDSVGDWFSKTKSPSSMNDTGISIGSENRPDSSLFSYDYTKRNHNNSILNRKKYNMGRF